MMIHRLITLVCCAFPAIAQTTSAPPAFEAASVKRDLSGGTGGAIRITRGGIFTASNSTLQALIRYAWDVKDSQIQAPAWMDTERYDIEARIPAGKNHDVPLMLQKLIAERFAAKINREVLPRPVYALVVAKDGPKLRASKPADSTAVTSSARAIVANKLTVSILASLLSGQMDRPVLDSTDLKGTYDLKLEWDPVEGPSVFTALEEQLGLKLESQAAPVGVIVVDYAEKIPTEN
jgi:uncharacterized protein (TIGR03435 family)